LIFKLLEEQTKEREINQGRSFLSVKTSIYIIPKICNISGNKISRSDKQICGFRPSVM